MSVINLIDPGDLKLIKLDLILIILFVDIRETIRLAQKIEQSTKYICCYPPTPPQKKKTNPSSQYQTYADDTQI